MNHTFMVVSLLIILTLLLRIMKLDNERSVGISWECHRSLVGGSMEFPRDNVGTTSGQPWYFAGEEWQIPIFYR